MTGHTIHLPDGRNLAYAVYGPADGRPVLYFHGTPSSRLEISLHNYYHLDIEQRLLALDLCLIAVDPDDNLLHQIIAILKKLCLIFNEK